MEELEKLEYPKPLRRLHLRDLQRLRAKHPGSAQENIRPKSIAREMFERFATFNDYVREYGLQRSEGVLLRYLSDAGGQVVSAERTSRKRRGAVAPSVA